MKQEAIRRVREMQRRSRNAADTENDFTETPSEKPAQDTTANKHSESGSTVNSLLGGLLGGNDGLLNLGGVKIDEEKALVGMLIYILYKQGADVKLLLGLGYLLL